MSTKAGTIEVAGRPAGIVVWTAIVSVLAAAALIMSAVALIEAGRDHGSVAGTAGGEALGVASSQAPLWDAGKLEAMRGRVLAETAVNEDYVLWDEAKVEAMAGRALAEN